MTQPFNSYLGTNQSGLGYEIQHGASCASATSAVSRDNAGHLVFGIGIEETIEIPQGLDQATVFMNGWRLRYRDNDHQILALSSAIVDIEVRDGNLNWFAGGILSDKNGDDDFDWCYSYTALFWKNRITNTDIGVSDSDTDSRHVFVSLDDVPNDSEQFAYANLLNLPFEPRALLPRGFGVMFRSREEDHKLLQFDLKHGDFTPQQWEDGSENLFWKFETVFQGKDRYRRYDTAQVVSALGGRSVEMMQTGFDIYSIPELHQDSGIEDVVTQDLVVENVPFDAAVPVLMGWSLADQDKEIQPQDMGVWIESFTYDRAPGAESGTLIYRVKSVFVDDNGTFSSNGSIFPRLQVNILGINNHSQIQVNDRDEVLTDVSQTDSDADVQTGAGTATGTTTVTESTDTPIPKKADINTTASDPVGGPSKRKSNTLP